MSLEADLCAAIAPILPAIYPDVAPIGVAKPYGVYQQVGGSVINPVTNAAPGLRNARVQVTLWALTRAEAASLMRQIEDALRAAPLRGQPVSALTAIYDDTTELRGARQDFTIWHA